MKYKSRMESGIINIIKKDCKFCGHTKAISKPRGIYCTRCKNKLMVKK